MNPSPVVLFRPANGGKFHVAPTSPALRALVESWMRAFPGSAVNADIDFEDWVEPASLLHAAIKQCPDRVAIIAGDQGAKLLDGKPVPESVPALFLGSWHKNDTPRTGVPSCYDLLGVMESIRHANRYFLLNAFLKYAGRPVVSCGIGEYEGDQVERDLWQELAAMSQRGVARAFVKVCRQKYAIYQVNLPLNATANQIMDHVIAAEEAMAWASVHLAGDPHGFMVQPYVCMEHEYRIIVVDHVPVAGAGCIEAFTPLDNAGIAWDEKTERKRSSGHVEHSPEIVAAYRQFAELVTAELREECAECSHYTLDVAMVDGRPAIVELNPLQNYGLYAMNNEHLVAALIAAADARCEPVICPYGVDNKNGRHHRL